MNINISEVNGTVVLSFDGKLDTGTAPDAENAFAEQIEGGAVNLLANFEKLSFISSAGLRVLLVTAKKTKAQSGLLKVCNMNDTVKEIFNISGFSTILNVYETQEEAVSG